MSTNHKNPIPVTLSIPSPMYREILTYTISRCPQLTIKETITLPVDLSQIANRPHLKDSVLLMSEGYHTRWDGPSSLDYIPTLSGKVLLLAYRATNELVERFCHLENMEGKGFLLWDAIGDRDSLVRAIQTIHEGGCVIGSEIWGMLTKDPSPSTKAGKSLERLLIEKDLTQRERQILAFIAEGYSNHYISLVLGISVRTAEKHIDTLYSKLGISHDSNRTPRVEASLLYNRWARAALDRHFSPNGNPIPDGRVHRVS